MMRRIEFIRLSLLFCASNQSTAFTQRSIRHTTHRAFGTTSSLSSIDGTAANDRDHLREGVQRALDKLQRQRKSLQSELTNSKECDKFSKRASLITTNLYQIPPRSRTVTLTSFDEKSGEPTPVTITLNTDKFRSAKEEADWLFSKARKMRRGTAAVTSLLAKNKRDIDFLSHVDVDDDESYRNNLLQSGMGVAVNDSENNKNNGKSQTARQQRKDSSSVSQTFREFSGPSEEDSPQILVGRNKKQNESLSFKIGKKGDFWLHARGCPGAHVILKNRSNKDRAALAGSLQLAANLALFYSDNRNELSAECSVTDPRHVLKPRGAPLGTVKLRKEDVMTAYPSHVPQECKDKRAEGVSKM